MKVKIGKLLIALIGLSIFIIALVILYHELKNYSIHEIKRQIRTFPPYKLGAGILFVIISYFILTFYDMLAFTYIKRKAPYHKIGFVSLVSYIFSNNIGFSAFSGSAVRLRFYQSMGLSSIEIAKIIFYTILAFWIGLFFSGGIAFLIEPVALPDVLHLPFKSIFPIAIIFLLIVAVYFALSFLLKKPFRFKNTEINFPRPLNATAQIFTGFLDWICFAFVLYILMPEHLGINFFTFFSIVILAQITALISNVPGGLGVFESIIMLLMPNTVNSAAVFGSLAIFRLIYYLIPLMIGTILFIIREMVMNRKKKGFPFIFGKWFPEVYPFILSLLIFIAGLILMISGVSPAERFRLEWLDIIFPVHVVEASHFFASLTGLALLILSYGIFKRLDASYYTGIILLLLGIVFSLLKGLDYEEALSLGVMLFLLLPCKKFFYRKASFFNEVFSFSWIFAVAIAVAGSIWLGFLYYRRVQYSNELWWTFELTNNASRFLRASLGISIGLLLFALFALFRPVVKKSHPPTADEIEKARQIINDADQSNANLALLGDKSFLFSDQDDAFIMYKVSGKSFIAMGDPIGRRENLAELIWKFNENAYKEGGYPVYYEISSEFLPIYIETGMALQKIGEEAIVDLNKFTIKGKSGQDFRSTLNRFAKEGITFRIIQSGNTCDHDYLIQLRKISDQWLNEKKAKEKQFSMGHFNPDYLKFFNFAIVEKDGNILAFTNIWESGHHYELSIDLMRYLPNVINGIMDFLFINLINWGKSEGFQYFNLGMAPLSGITNRPWAPLWNKITTVIFDNGENFYNFHGLRNYKNKFNPIWKPKYLASPGGLMFPRIITDVTSLINGGIKGAITK